MKQTYKQPAKPASKPAASKSNIAALVLGITSLLLLVTLCIVLACQWPQPSKNMEDLGDFTVMDINAKDMQRLGLPGGVTGNAGTILGAIDPEELTEKELNHLSAVAKEAGLEFTWWGHTIQVADNDSVFIFKANGEWMYADANMYQSNVRPELYVFSLLPNVRFDTNTSFYSYSDDVVSITYAFMYNDVHYAWVKNELTNLGYSYTSDDVLEEITSTSDIRYITATHPDGHTLLVKYTKSGNTATMEMELQLAK